MSIALLSCACKRSVKNFSVCLFFAIMVNGGILIPLTLELYVYYCVLCIIELHSYIRLNACFFAQNLKSDAGTARWGVNFSTDGLLQISFDKLAKLGRN